MINRHLLMGRIVNDLELRKTNSGLSVITFTIACERPHKSGEEKVSDFLNCRAWRGTAEFIEKYFSKGQMIAIEGAVRQEKWTDKEGKNHSTEVTVIDSVHFLDYASNKKSSEPMPEPAADADDYEINNDDLPF